jgi:hypothetical protein
MSHEGGALCKIRADYPVCGLPAQNRKLPVTADEGVN